MRVARRRHAAMSAFAAAPLSVRQRQQIPSAAAARVFWRLADRKGEETRTSTQARNARKSALRRRQVCRRARPFPPEPPQAMRLSDEARRRCWCAASAAVQRQRSCRRRLLR